MTKLRIAAGTLRKLLGNISNLIEGPGEKESPEEKRLRLQKWLDSQGDELLSKKEKEELERAASPGKAQPKPPVEPPSPGTRALDDPKAGSGRTLNRGEKTKPGYAPGLPKDAGKSPAWLRVFDEEAYGALRAMGNPEGKVYTQGPYVMFRPDDPAKKTLFWAGVPGKKINPADIPDDELPPANAEKPIAWRTWSELKPDQRAGLGWVDPRDRGKAGPDETPPPENKPLGVRFKGGAGGRVDVETGGFVPPTGSAAASVDAARAAALRDAPLPDWRTLGRGDLEKFEYVFSKRLKTSGDPSDRKALAAIRDALDDRRNGVPPLVAPTKQKTSSVRQPRRPEEYSQPPDARWGKRKRWGDTSSDVEITRVTRPKK